MKRLSWPVPSADLPSTLLLSRAVYSSGNTQRRAMAELRKRNIHLSKDRKRAGGVT